MKSTIIGTIFMRICIFLLGLILFLPALNKLYMYCNYRFNGIMVYGIVDHPSAGRDIGGRPLIQYSDTAGVQHEFKSRAKTHWFRTPRKGEEIKIFISSKEPKDAIVDSLFYYVFLPLIFLAAGSYCCLHAVFYRRK